MALITREQILATRRKEETFPVEEFGGDVRIREYSSKLRDHFEGEITGNGTSKGQISYDNLRARAVAAAIIDEEGNLLFNPDDPADIAALGEIGSSGVNKVFQAVLKLNGMKDEQKAVTDAAKN